MWPRLNPVIIWLGLLGIRIGVACIGAARQHVHEAHLILRRLFFIQPSVNPPGTNKRDCAGHDKRATGWPRRGRHRGHSAPVDSRGLGAFRERHKVMWRDRQFRSMRRVASIGKPRAPGSDAARRILKVGDALSASFTKVAVKRASWCAITTRCGFWTSSIFSPAHIGSQGLERAPVPAGAALGPRVGHVTPSSLVTIDRGAPKRSLALK